MPDLLPLQKKSTALLGKSLKNIEEPSKSRADESKNSPIDIPAQINRENSASKQPEKIENQFNINRNKKLNENNNKKKN